jgi:hypothetical protein
MSVTFGSGVAPSQVTLNLDSLFGLSLAAYRKELIDNIGATNAFFHELIKGELYESQDGGTYIQIPVMYGLQTADSYDGYDELSTVPVDGVTDAIYQWSQMAAAIVYSMKEVKQNKQRLVNLVKSRIKQAEMGIQEFFSQSLWWGAAAQGGALTSNYVSTINGSTGINPMFQLVSYTPTTSTSIGNINQSTNTWWQNVQYTSAATTYDGFILEVDHVFNTAALGTGGKPKIVIGDQVSYELFVHALYQKYRYTRMPTDEAYPFENVMYKGCHFTLDDKVPDVKNSIIPTLTAGRGSSSSLTNGTMVYLNPEFFHLMYEEESDFEMLKDEGGKTIFKPVNDDSRVGHIAWMGNLCTDNRRKQAVHGGIARTLTTP